MRLTCFKDMPAALRLQLTCDALARSASILFAQERRAAARFPFGSIGIQGQLVFLLQTGPQSRLLIAAGGFHPNFKNVPEGLPRKIDRLAVVYDVGKLQAWVKGYFAVAAGTIQFGFDLGCRYKAGSLAFAGNVRDRRAYPPEPFAFEAGLHINAAVEFRGHELFGVHIKGTIWGPDSWRIKGRGEISILFWDVGIDVDESWGDDVGASEARIALEALVAEDLRNPTNWLFDVPAQARSLINFAGDRTGADGLAHPLATLTYRQRRVPFGLRLDHVGSAGIDGLSLFPVPRMHAAAGHDLPGDTVTDPFAWENMSSSTTRRGCLGRARAAALVVSAGTAAYRTIRRASKASMSTSNVPAAKGPSNVTDFPS